MSAMCRRLRSRASTCCGVRLHRQARQTLFKPTFSGGSSGQGDGDEGSRVRVGPTILRPIPGRPPGPRSRTHGPVGARCGRPQRPVSSPCSCIHGSTAAASVSKSSMRSASVTSTVRTPVGSSRARVIPAPVGSAASQSVAAPSSVDGKTRSGNGTRNAAHCVTATTQLTSATPSNAPKACSPSRTSSATAGASGR